VGVDAQGDKHVLGLREECDENAAAVRALLAESGRARDRCRPLVANRDRRGQSAAQGVAEVFVRTP